MQAPMTGNPAKWRAEAVCKRPETLGYFGAAARFKHNQASWKGGQALILERQAGPDSLSFKDNHSGEHEYNLLNSFPGSF